MNLYFVVAAVLAIAIGLAHSVLGERYILIRLFRQPNIPHLFGTDDFTKRTLRFAWHLTTIICFGLAALLFILASFRLDRSGRMLSGAIAATFLACAILALIGSRGRHLSWVVLLIIAVLVLMGIG